MVIRTKMWTWKKAPSEKRGWGWDPDAVRVFLLRGWSGAQRGTDSSGGHHVKDGGSFSAPDNEDSGQLQEDDSGKCAG